MRKFGKYLLVTVLPLPSLCREQRAITFCIKLDNSPNRLDIVCHVYLVAVSLAFVFQAVIVVATPQLTTVTQLF